MWWHPKWEAVNQIHLTLIQLGAVEKEWERPDMKEPINRFQPQHEENPQVTLTEAITKNKNNAWPDITLQCIIYLKDLY